MFEKLPDTYQCHVCDSPKKYFVAVGNSLAVNG
jgi:rubredoxin